jgi:FAD dependent oxidoreductase TIGR03364
MDRSADVAVVGAGIVGLAHAYMALKKGLRVVLFDREQFAVGASARNFGLVWPIGQQPGIGLTRAFRSRHHWLELASEAGFWINPSGSLHLAYHPDEQAVLEEFLNHYADTGFDARWIDPKQTLEKSEVVNPAGLRGALWSSTECTVNPRQAIRKIPQYLEQRYGLILRWGQVVKEIALPTLETARERWSVSQVFICSGADFETLYPQHLDRPDLTKCKLQMLKGVAKDRVTIGPALCAGLTLRHYASFSSAPSLPALDSRFDQEDPRWKEDGIHVLLSQNDAGELIIGDSHRYALTHEPFLYTDIDERILSYLNRFTRMSYTITERWYGVYPRLKGQLDLTQQVEPGVTLVNGLGGAGMTLSFGLAEENLASL